MKKTILKLTAATMLLLALLLTGAGCYMLNYALCPEAEVAARRDAAWEDLRSRYPGIVPWLDSLRCAGALRDTTITAPDGARLHALYAEAHRPTRRTAVIVHGYTDCAVRMLMIGCMYHRDLGCNILLPDLRYHGASDGRAIGMGWPDRLDVLRWMEVADRRFGGHTQQVVHGISMGAATTMMVSGEQLPTCARCFVEDCGYTSVEEEFRGELKAQFGLPAFPLLGVASRLCKLFYGWSFSEASALEQVRKCRLPMLFIHGDADTFVPTRMVYPLYEAKPGLDKELWIVPGTAHAAAYRNFPEEYTARVGRFVDRYLGPEEADTIAAINRISSFEPDYAITPIIDSISRNRARACPESDLVGIPDSVAYIRYLYADGRPRCEGWVAFYSDPEDDSSNPFGEWKYYDEQGTCYRKFWSYEGIYETDR